MFHTIAYRGHHIQLATTGNRGEVKVRIQHQDGGFHLVQVRTLLGAMRAITHHNKSQGVVA